MKKLTISIVVALFGATVFAPAHVDASWLPKRSEYPSNFSLHQVVGNPLDAIE